MKRFLLPLIAIALIPTSPLHAQEAKSVSIRLVELMNFSNSAKQAATVAFAPTLQKLKAQGMSEEALKEVNAAANRFFAKVFENPAIITDIAQIYDNSFSKEEMEGLILFYNTPLGKKSLVVMPQVMQQSMAVGQKHAAKNQAEFQEELKAIMQKNAVNKTAPAPAE